MTFKGDSYVRYSLHDKKTKISSFSVSLRTTKPSGTIFSVKGDKDYFTLEVQFILLHKYCLVNHFFHGSLLITVKYNLR